MRTRTIRWFLSGPDSAKVVLVLSLLPLVVRCSLPVAVLSPSKSVRGGENAPSSENQATGSLLASAPIGSPGSENEVRPVSGGNQTFGRIVGGNESVNDAWIGRFLASGSFIRSLALLVAVIGATVWSFQAAKAAPRAFWTVACKLASRRKHSK